MALPTRRTAVGESLTASAAKYTRLSEGGYRVRRSLDWQRRALAYIDIVPELSYSSRFYARMLRQLRVFPGVMDSEGQIKEITDGLPVELLGRLKGRDGTMRQILANYGRLMFSAGEGNLLGLNIGTENEFWSFVWLDEVVIETDGDGDIRKIIHRPYANNDGIEYTPNQARVYRLWTPHPRRSGEADSPMRSVLEIAEELIILTSAVRSTAVSRTVSGLLLMPSEMAPLPAEPLGDEDPENDPFMDEMLAHLESQIEDAGSAAASAPWVIWGAYELLDKIRRVDLHDPQTDYMERDLRKEAVERMARGLDYPPEVLTGLSNSNHWAAKQIIDDMWRSHGAPIADQFVGDINDAYLRPALRAAQYPDWENVVIGYDESQIVIPADRSADADAAIDRGAISNEGYRKLKNIPERYAPSDAEHQEWLAVKLREGALIGMEKPSTPPRDVSISPPAPGPQGDSGRSTRVVAASDERRSDMSMEVGAAEMALARCRELAGIRIRQKEKSAPEIVKLADGSSAASVAAKLGSANIDALSLNTNQLVRGGADTFRTLLSEWGYAETQVAAIAEMVESYAARTLFSSEHPRLPAGFAAQFERAKEASSG